VSLCYFLFLSLSSYIEVHFSSFIHFIQLLQRDDPLDNPLGALNPRSSLLGLPVAISDTFLVSNPSSTPYHTSSDCNLAHTGQSATWLSLSQHSPSPELLYIPWFRHPTYNTFSNTQRLSLSRGPILDRRTWMRTGETAVGCDMPLVTRGTIERTGNIRP
jgi:hypothetical protein